jgi:PPK2 family polyphosphate:nucleotide phosphotransferase
MKLVTRKFMVEADESVRLDKWPTRVAPVYRSDVEYREMLARHVAKLSDLQELLFASNLHSLLVVFQGMDTSGKDGAIKHVMTGVNPQGCRVISFKHPSGSELQHDFLWRTTRELPERGRIGIFNRSYYEEVVVVRVHPELLLAEGLPDTKGRNGKVWRGRYKSINGLEGHLTRSGTRVVKFFLHLSKEEQRKRLLARIDDPGKQWKFQATDVQERDYWDHYMSAYSDCIEATSTRDAPWYIVPADDKPTARLIVSQVLTEALENLGMRLPTLDAAAEDRLRAFRAALQA